MLVDVFMIGSASIVSTSLEVGLLCFWGFAAQLVRGTMKLYSVQSIPLPNIVLEMIKPTNFMYSNEHIA